MENLDLGRVLTTSVKNPGDCYLARTRLRKRGCGLFTVRHGFAIDVETSGC